MNKYIPNLTNFCFDKEDFFKIVFSVDSFLRKNKQTELSIIRNDLGLYLKFLRAALIDLINQDYTDFVSLSGNLKCLDTLIKSIVAPLLYLKNEMCHKKQIFSSNLSQLKNCYVRKCKIQTLRKTLVGLLKVNAYCRNLEHLTNYTQQITYLERAFLAVAQINYNKTFCSNVKCIEKSQCDNLEKQLWTNLQDTFTTNFKTNNDEIKACLRIYILLNSCNVAENIFMGKVKYNIDNVLSKKNAEKDHISTIYNEILDFIALNMKALLFITYYTNEIKGFNFLVNGFWTELVDRFLTTMTSLYVTGNPNLFYNNYLSTANFMLRIETMLKTKNEIKIFRQNSKTRQFEKKWNFSVYFQIRYLEIATDLEKACTENFKQIFEGNEINCGDKVKLPYTSVACDSLTKCWSDCSNIHQLFPKYLKLTYHILSKVVKSTKDILVEQKKVQNINKIALLVSLYNNINNFLNFMEEINSKIINKNPSILLEKALFEKSFQDSTLSITILLKEVEQSIVFNLVSSSSEFMGHVTDVSRLYRKTNRDIPKKHSFYVQNMLDPVDSFQNLYGRQMCTEIIAQIIKEYFSQITCKYYNSTEEALSSVNKTENSLKRLKIVRGKTESDNSTNSRISDDNKIRLQLELDVNFWSTEIQNRNFKPEEITKLYELNQLVQNATKSIKC